jgi:hypothetical protein
MDEIRPPMIVWIRLVLLPGMERWTANKNDILPLLRVGGGGKKSN